MSVLLNSVISYCVLSIVIITLGGVTAPLVQKLCPVWWEKHIIARDPNDTWQN